MPRGKYAKRRAARLRRVAANTNTMPAADGVRESIALMHDRLGEPNVIGYYPSADGIPDDGAFRSSPELVDALLDTFERSESTGELNPDGTFTVTNTGPYTRPELERQNVAPLRDIARELGLKPGRARKADLIDAILAKQWAHDADGLAAERGQRPHLDNEGNEIHG